MPKVVEANQTATKT
jgi:hypothetical protein